MFNNMYLGDQMDIEFILNKMLLDVDFSLLSLYAEKALDLDNDWLILL